uniref:Uncharacterized protein n=1 Tax=Knipowitschia caucasica TaxID=637954 RepID=A0AAV2LXG0_KNICA
MGSQGVLDSADPHLISLCTSVLSLAFLAAHRERGRVGRREASSGPPVGSAMIHSAISWMEGFGARPQRSEQGSKPAVTVPDGGNESPLLLLLFASRHSAHVQTNSTGTIVFIPLYAVG